MNRFVLDVWETRVSLQLKPLETTTGGKKVQSAGLTIVTCCNESQQNTVLEATLQLPPSLLQSPAAAAVAGQTDDTAAAATSAITTTVFKLYLLAFRNGKFFPSTGNSTLLADGGKRRSVATPVVMAWIGQ